MRTVAYDLTGLQVNASGVARAMTGLRDALAEHDGVRLLSVAQPPRRPRVPPPAHALAREAWWLPVGAGRAARRAGADLLHCPCALAPARPVGLPVVVTVFDVMPLERPEWFTRRNTWHLRALLGGILRHAAGVITASAYSRDALLERFAFLEPERVVVVPCGVDAAFTPGPGPQGARPYVLTVGELQPRKNLEGALRAFEAVAGDLPEHELVVVGARGWREEELLERVGSSPVAGRVRLTGRVSDAQLVELYRGADCLVYPSRHEGFGLPPLEAMACGTPVVCSDRTSLPEVVGDAALLADPDDDAALAGALAAVLGDPDRARALAQAGLARAARFTWAAAAQGTVEAYEAALRRWALR